MEMFHFGFAGLLVILFYLVFVGGMITLLILWAVKSIKLRKEQNELLREIIRKMDK
ncbi:MAG: hypothetical protein U0T82_10675 [Bacteroidales bacterium]